MKMVKKFQMKIVIFTAVKNCCILHGRVFVKFFVKYVNTPMQYYTIFKAASIDHFQMQNVRYFSSFRSKPMPLEHVRNALIIRLSFKTANRVLTAREFPYITIRTSFFQVKISLLPDIYVIIMAKRFHFYLDIPFQTQTYKDVSFLLVPLSTGTHTHQFQSWLPVQKD